MLEQIRDADCLGRRDGRRRGFRALPGRCPGPIAALPKIDVPCAYEQESSYRTEYLSHLGGEDCYALDASSVSIGTEYSVRNRTKHIRSTEYRVHLQKAYGLSRFPEAGFPGGSIPWQNQCSPYGVVLRESSTPDLELS